MEYKCKRIEENLTIDADLSKVEWIKANDMQLVDTVTGEAISHATSVRLLWNADYLYIAFQGEEDFIYATYDKFNDPLYEEDVVEIFLDDDKDLKTYIELEVNPRNAVLHYNMQNDLNGHHIAFARVENTITSAVLYDEEKRSLSYEIAIPMNEFITAKHMPPQKGDTWLFNAYRINHKKDGTLDHYAAAKTEEVNFHKPMCFFTLAFE